MTKHKQLDEDTFIEVYSATQSPIKAAIAAQPELITNKRYATQKALRTLKKTDIQDRIQKKMEKMANKASKRIDKLIASDDESIATQNAWKVIEQVRGKAVTRSINLSATANIEDALFD